MLEHREKHEQIACNDVGDNDDRGYIFIDLLFEGTNVSPLQPTYPVSYFAYSSDFHRNKGTRNVYILIALNYILTWMAKA
jgi:hypothetical protein